MRFTTSLLMILRVPPKLEYFTGRNISLYAHHRTLNKQFAIIYAKWSGVPLLNPNSFLLQSFNFSLNRTFCEFLLYFIVFCEIFFDEDRVFCEIKYEILFTKFHLMTSKYTILLHIKVCYVSKKEQLVQQDQVIKSHAHIMHFSSSFSLRKEKRCLIIQS